MAFLLLFGFVIETRRRFSDSCLRVHCYPGRLLDKLQPPFFVFDLVITLLFLLWVKGYQARGPWHHLLDCGGQHPRRTVYLTPAGSIFCILFFRWDAFRVSNGSTCFPFGSCTAAINFEVSLTKRIALELRQLHCSGAVKTRLCEISSLLELWTTHTPEWSAILAGHPRVQNLCHFLWISFCLFHKK